MASPAPATEARTLPERLLLIALLFTGMVFCYAQRGALGIAAPAMIKELGLSPAVMGLLLSAFFWTYSFLQMPAGWLVDRLGVKRGYALGYAVWSAASMLTGFATGRVALVAARMMLGIGQAVAFPASARAVAFWFSDRERGLITATYLTGVRIGQALIGAVGVFLLAAYGFRGFFVLIGLIPLIWLLPWFLVLGRQERAVRPGAQQPVKDPPARLSFLESLALMKNRTVLGIFLGFFAYDYAWFVYVNWLPGYLVLERKFSKGEVAFYTSVPYVAMSVVILVSGLLSDWFIRRGRSEAAVRKLFIAVGLLVACLMVPAGLVEDRVTAMWLVTLSLCGLGIAAPNTWTLTQAVCPKRIVGTVSGIQNFGGNVGGIIAPALTGYIAHTTGSFSLAFSFTGGILVAGILAYLLLISRKVEIDSR